MNFNHQKIVYIICVSIPLSQVLASHPKYIIQFIEINSKWFS